MRMLVQKPRLSMERFARQALCQAMVDVDVQSLL
jgi:hypothetical protein